VENILEKTGKKRGRQLCFEGWDRTFFLFMNFKKSRKAKRVKSFHNHFFPSICL
jgi:gluconate kinase